MCGIAGMLSLAGDRPADSALLTTMTGLLAHRGPDDQGFYLDGPVGLGHRRLSILDIADGQQPWVDAQRGLALVYNGELYNYRELREVLRGKGVVFRSNCDTEVLLQVSHTARTDWLECLNGMFAFALWDTQRRELFLARDRLGIKPLYYCVYGGRFYFASEVKAVLACGVPRRLNEEAVPEYLAFRSVSGVDTMIRGVRVVPPGYFLRIQPGDAEPRLHSYWDGGLGDSRAWTDRARPLNHQFTDLLESAVRYRLIADVPVGTYNSGGVDSSLVTEKVRMHLPGELHTFSVGFEEDDHDESRYAEVVAGRLGTRHHALVMNDRQYADAIEEAAWYCDLPLNHAHSVQLMRLSRLAKEFVTVVLTGEGADEVFAGYPRYQIPILARRLASLPRPLHEGFRRLLRTLRMRRMVKLLEVSYDQERSVLENARFCSLDDLQSLGVEDFVSAARRRTLGEVQRKPLSYLEQVLEFDRRTYLPSLLTRLDRTTMASGVEARVPFLDHRLVEWSMGLPSRAKLTMGLGNKVIVKRIAAGIFPRDMIYRRKVGFGVPVGRWFRKPKGLGRYLQLLTDDTFKERGYCEWRAVNALVQSHLAGNADHGDILWGLVSLELWLRIFLDRPVAAPQEVLS